MTPMLPSSTALGTVRLRVADLERSLAFYRELLGFAALPAPARSAILGAGDIPLIELREVPGLAPRPGNATGLFHVAILLPDRPALGAMLRRLVQNGVGIGASDHIVSEALYLDDPDGNGLEIYCDRSPASWSWTDGEIDMATVPLDAEAVLRQAAPDTRPYGLPAGTRIGHMHLQVGDLAAARAFYVDALGFDVTTGSYPGALFVSAGGYHHHIGLNVWRSRGKGLAPSDSAGLDAFQIVLPDGAGVRALRQRLHVSGIASTADGEGFAVTDPWGNRIEVTARPPYAKTV